MNNYNFNIKYIENKLSDLNNKIKEILDGIDIIISFTCEIDYFSYYEILIELKNNYVDEEQLAKLNKFMNNLNYRFNSILNSQNHIIIKYKR